MATTDDRTPSWWAHTEDNEALQSFLKSWSEPVSRRTYLQRAGLLLSSAGLLVYGHGPGFWNQMIKEMSSPVVPPPFRPDPAAWPDDGLFAAWLGHSTVLLKIDGFTILTDPTFSDRAGVSLGPLTFGPKRMVEPALPVQSLPPIDLILLSHAHMDHLDVPSLRALEGPGTEVVTARHTSDLIRVDRYRRVRELRWGQVCQVGPIECRAFEVRHWGARLRHDHHRGYNGYLLETGRHKIVYAGDTALTNRFRQLKSGKAIDLMIMPIGAYDPFIANHCTPEQAWAMSQMAGGRYVLPVHHQTFNLSREPKMEPIERLLQVAHRELDRLPVKEIGQEFQFA